MTIRYTAEQLAEVLDHEGYADLGAESIRVGQFEGDIVPPSEITPSEDKDQTKINPRRR